MDRLSCLCISKRHSWFKHPAVHAKDALKGACKHSSALMWQMAMACQWYSQVKEVK
jgi:hypothetical protein